MNESAYYIVHVKEKFCVIIYLFIITFHFEIHVRQEVAQFYI